MECSPRLLRKALGGQACPQAWVFGGQDRRCPKKGSSAYIKRSLCYPLSPAGQRQWIKAPLFCSPAFPLIPSDLLLSPPTPCSSPRLLCPLPCSLSGASLQPHTTSPAPLKHQLPLRMPLCLCPFCSLCLELLSLPLSLDPGLALEVLASSSFTSQRFTKHHGFVRRPARGQGASTKERPHPSGKGRKQRSQQELETREFFKRTKWSAV